MISLRVLWGALRTVGLEQPLWWLVYRYQLGSGLVAIRSPLRAWDALRFEDAVRPGAQAEADRYLTGEASPRLFIGDARGLAPQLIALMGPSLQTLSDEAVLASTGRFRLWEDAFRSLGLPPAWNRNPLTEREQEATKHWTFIAERSTGDVKGLWEASRFSIAYRLARLYAATGEERAAQQFTRLVDSWLQANPPNGGPQWISAQEVGLRAMAWVFALNGMWGSSALGREQRTHLAIALREHGRRIEASLAYGLAQGNNHVLSEAAALWTLGLAFPWMREAGRWAARGRRMLIAAAKSQIEPEGGYIQHSVNYQRLAAQVLAWSVRMGEVHERPFPRETYARLRAMRDCMAALVDEGTGRAPNLGHNDGSLVFPLTTCAYEDYRPVLQSLSLLCDGHRTLAPGPWDEEALWLMGSLPAGEEAQHASQPAVPRADARGGMIALRFEDGRGYLRCARFHNRPAHADQLQADLWSGDLNFACDAGTYLYGGDRPWENALAGSWVHNTVVVDGRDQMERVGRFLWVAENARAERMEAGAGFTLGVASHGGYRRLGILHRRALVGLDGQAWIIVDDLLGRGAHALRLHWLTPDGELTLMRGDPDDRLVEFSCLWKDRRARAAVWGSSGMQVNLVRAGVDVLGASEKEALPREVRGWRSLRYASREPALSLTMRMQASLPARFVTIWVMSPDETLATLVDPSGRTLSLSAGTVELNPIGSPDPIASVRVSARPSGSG